MSDELERLIADLISSNNGTNTDIDDDEIANNSDVPAEVPILPLRGLVVYPHTAIPLTVGQQRSLKLVDDVIEGNRLVGLFTALNPELETPGPDDIYRVGTLAAIHRLFRAPDGTIRLLVQGLKRIRIEEFTSEEPYLNARIKELPEAVEGEIEVEALERNVMEQFRHLADLMPSIPPELVTTALATDDPLQLAYSVATYVRIDLENAQKLLEEDSTQQKLRLLLELLNKEVEVLELGRKIQTEAQSEMEKSQREYYLREQLKAIQRELAEGDDSTEEVGQFRKAIDEAGMSEEARKEAERELDRLSKLSVASAEYGVIRTYLDWLVNMPWNKRTEDNLDISHARQVLEEDHYGLKDIKERILEFLAVRKLRAERGTELKSQEEEYSV
ncbi:MAG: LON peptidase substrate-binding domain-containing protein, partial [Anaerolineae bacterium]|nr:LON peptidase substrate-binding domain-containing protein [Anaerolineae bacterium]